MSAHPDHFGTLDPLYQLAMLRVFELQSDAMRGREFRRVRIAGSRRT
jgi:hypothetical protein